MIHPRLATMLAVVTTDYPLEPGEPIEFLRPQSSRASTGSPSTASARRTTRSCSSRTARAASSGAPRSTSSSRPRSTTSAPRSRGEIVADGEGTTVLLEIAVAGAAVRCRGGGGRPENRDLAARQDGRFRARPELGARARCGGIGAVERRLRACRRRAPDGRVRRNSGLRPRRADRSRARARRLVGGDRRSTSGSARGAPHTSRPT